jgi:hypothetical protein
MGESAGCVDAVAQRTQVSSGKQCARLEDRVTGRRAIFTLQAGVAVSLLAACLVQIGAGVALLGLQADGAYCLRVLLTRQDFSCIEPARRTVQMLLEAPTLGAVLLGLRDVHAASVIYSLSLQLMPVALTALACVLAPAGQPRLMLLPVFAYFAGASPVASIGLIEGPTATAFFWAMYFAILSVPERRVPLALLALGAAATLLTHEVMALLAPALAWAAWWRAQRAGSMRFVFRLLAVWFVVVALVQWAFVLWPHNVANRDGFVAQMLGLHFLIAASGFNVPAALGLLSACGLLMVWRVPGAVAAVTLGLAAVAALLLNAAIVAPWWFLVPISQFYARNVPALLSVPLAVLAAAALWRPHMAWPASERILAVLVVATLGYQVLQTMAWAVTMAAFRETLRGPPGLVSWEDAIDAAPLPRRAALLRANWRWTMPDLSIVLAEGGQVRRIVLNPTGHGWQPWDPTKPGDWPTSALFHIDLPPAAARTQP